MATRAEGGHGLGAKVTGWTGIGPIGFTDPMRITDWDPPRRCTVTHLGTVVRGSGTFEVLPRDGRDGTGRSHFPEFSEFRWTEVIELPLPLPAALARLVATALVGPAARAGLGWSLRKFARLIGGIGTPATPKLG